MEQTPCVGYICEEGNPNVSYAQKIYAGTGASARCLLKGIEYSLFASFGLRLRDFVTWGYHPYSHGVIRENRGPRSGIWRKDGDADEFRLELSPGIFRLPPVLILVRDEGPDNLEAERFMFQVHPIAASPILHP